MPGLRVDVLRYGWEQTAPPACSPVEPIDRPRICSRVEPIDRPRCDGAGPLGRWFGVVAAMIGGCFCVSGPEPPFLTYHRWGVGRRAVVSIVGACAVRCGSAARLPAALGRGVVFFWGRLSCRPHANGARTKGKLFIGVTRPRCRSSGASVPPAVVRIEGPARKRILTGIEASRYFLTVDGQETYGNSRDIRHTCLPARGSTWGNVADRFPGNARQAAVSPDTLGNVGSADPRGYPPRQKCAEKCA